MTRLEALEAVAEAVQEWVDRGGVVSAKIFKSLDALDVAPTQGEAVEVAVWCTDVEYRFSLLTEKASRVLVGAGYTRIGTTFLPIRATEGGGE
jgi:hypothetical protein